MLFARIFLAVNSCCVPSFFVISRTALLRCGRSTKTLLLLTLHKIQPTKGKSSLNKL
jgi:hypothetical protein